MPDQTYVTKFLIDAAEAIGEGEKYIKLIQSIAAEMRTAKNVSGQSFKEIAHGMKLPLRDLKESSERAAEMLKSLGIADISAANNAALLTSAINETANALTREQRELAKTEAAKKKLAAESKNLAQVLTNTLSVALGINLYNAIRMVINGFKEMVSEGMELLKSMYQLEVGVRVLRRSGMNIVTKDVLDNIDKLREKFGIFTTKELVQGSASFANLIRDLGFTKDQFFELQNAAATLAVVNGRAMDDVQRTIALALSSGYTEGLQRLGVSINRVTIALEAERLGWGRNYMSLTETQRSIATYNLLIGKTIKYQDDLATYTSTAAGAFDKLKTSVTNFIQINIGTNIARFVGGIALLVDAINKLDAAVREASPQWYKNLRENLALIPTGIEMFGIFGRQLEGFAKIITLLADKTLDATEKWRRVGEEARKTNDEIFRMMKGELLLESFAPEETPVGVTPAAAGAYGEEDTAQKQADALEKLYEDTRQLEADYQNDQRDAWTDYGRDIEKIDRDTQYAIADQLNSSFERQKREADKAHDDTLKVREKLALDILQENRKFNTALSEGEAKHRENELKAEIDFQEQMQKLREGFLLDLEDAVRERDARQVLMLIRRYNLQRTQATREYGIQKEEMDRQRALEVQELINQRNERIQVLQEEAALRIAQIERETVAAIQAEQDSNLKKIDEIKKSAQREKDERYIKLQQQLQDLDIHLQDRYNRLILSFVDEFNLTRDALDAQMREYEKSYGPNGRMQRAWDYGIAYSRAAVKAIATALNSLWGVNVKSLGQIQQANLVTSTQASTLNQIQQANYPTTTPIPKQKGGLDYVTKPTLFLAGEGGVPEWHQWIPANKLGSNGGIGGMGGKVDIALLLSPDLEARIVSNTLSRTANVILELQRAR